MSYQRRKREYPLNNEVLPMNKDLSQAALPKKVLQFSQVTDISHTEERLNGKVPSGFASH